LVVSFNQNYFHSSRSRWPQGLRRGSAAARCGDCGFECKSVSCDMCCQVEVCVSRWSLIQRSPTECVCVCHWIWSDATI